MNLHLKDYIKIENNNAYIKVKVIPKSRESWFFSVMDDWTLKIRIKSLPERGKANNDLIAYFSKELDVKKNNIKILSWAQDQIKIIKIDFF